MRFLYLIGLFLFMSCAQNSNEQEKGRATNPYLANDKLATTHFDLAQSDNFPDPVPEGEFNIDPQKLDRIPGGPVNIITLKSTEEGFWWGLGTDRISYIDGRKGKWNEVARYNWPQVAQIEQSNLDAVLGSKYALSDALARDYYKLWAPNKLANPTLRMMTGNAIYAVVNNKNDVYVTASGHIYKMGVQEGKVVLKASIELKSKMSVPDQLKAVIPLDKIPGGIQGVNISYDGSIFVGTIFGMMAVDENLENILDNMSFPIEHFYSTFPPKVGGTPEFISNSFAIDSQNSIYVATGSRMNKVIWDGSHFSNQSEDGAWSQPYKTGDLAPTIKYGKGTGSTPTLMGFGPDEDELVVITDGQNQMNLVAFWRAQKKGSQIADQIDVQCGFTDPPEFIQSEQSVAVLGDGAFVVNNIAPDPQGLRNYDEANDVADLIFNVLAVGPIVNPGQGVERFQWNKELNKWERVWADSYLSSTSMVPAISSTSEIVLINTYDVDLGWQVVGLDWNSGDVVHQVNFGKTSYGNGAYALIEYFKNGDLLFNGIGGPMRVPLSED